MRDHSCLRPHWLAERIVAARRLSVVCAAICLLPLSVFAQDETGTTHSKVIALLSALLPIIVISVILFWLFRKVHGKNQQHIDRHRQHMERIEQVFGADRDSAEEKGVNYAFAQPIPA